MLDAAIRIARAEEATLVAAYLLVVPLQYPEDSPRRDQVAVAVPLLEAVEHAALRAACRSTRGSRKAARLTTRLASVGGRGFERIVAPAPSGFTPKELAWILDQRPGRDDRPSAGAGLAA